MTRESMGKWVCSLFGSVVCSWRNSVPDGQTGAGMWGSTRARSARLTANGDSQVGHV